MLLSLVNRELVRVRSIEVELKEQTPAEVETVDDAEVERMRRKRDGRAEQ